VDKQEDVVRGGHQVDAVDGVVVVVVARRRPDIRDLVEGPRVDDRGDQSALLEDEEEAAAVVHGHSRRGRRPVQCRPLAAALAEEHRVA